MRVLFFVRIRRFPSSDNDFDDKSQDSVNPTWGLRRLTSRMILGPLSHVVFGMETSILNLNPAKLMALSQVGMVSGSAQPSSLQPEQIRLAGDRDQVVTLRPRPHLWLRKTLFCAWSGYLIIAPWTSSFKLDCCLLALIILGTFRTTTVSATGITWRYHFGFMPYYQRQMPLQDQTTILTGWEESSGLGEALLLGLWSMGLAPLADWLCPWPGGAYRLWLKNNHGQQVLVWRGRVERTFHRNHKLLGQATRLPSQRAPSR